MKKQKKIGEFNPGDFNLDFNTDFQLEDPLPSGTPFDNLPYTGDVEKDTEMELNEYQKENRQQKRQYQAIMDGIFDSEFWFAVAFKDRKTKDEFLKEFGFDKLGDKYIDGGKLAKALRKMKGK